MNDTWFKKEFKPLMTGRNVINLDPLKNVDTFPYHAMTLELCPRQFKHRNIIFCVVWRQ